MIHGRRILFLVTAALAAGHIVLGCADQGDDVTPPPAPADDGGAEAEASVADARATDAPVDAAHDADAAPKICSADGWCYAPLPEAGSFDAGPGGNTGNPGDPLFRMTSVWTGSDHQTWAVTAGGHVLKWDGAAWSVVTVLGASLHAIFGTSPTDLWIAGDSALLVHGTVTSGKMTFTPVIIDTYQSFLGVWGSSPTSIWVLGSDGAVFHLEPADAGVDAGPSFAPVNLPSDYPGDYNYFRATSIFGKGTDLWIAGKDETYCDPIKCEYVSELVVRKWKGGNAGESSWDRVRIPMAQDGVIAMYSNINLGVAATDGVQLVFVDNGGFVDGRVVRISTTAGQLTPGLDGILHHDGAYSWTAEATPNFTGPQGIWATDSKNVWLAGPAGVRHYDGTVWQIGRLSIVPGSPLLKDLHSIQGAAPPSTADMWTVGDDVALHRTVSP